MSEKGWRTVSIDRHPKINGSGIPDSHPFVEKDVVCPPKKLSDRTPFSKGGAGLQGGRPARNAGCRAGSPAKKCQKRDGARYPWTGTQKSTAPAYRILHPFVERMLFVRRKSFRIDPFFKRGRRVAGRETCKERRVQGGKPCKREPGLQGGEPCKENRVQGGSPAKRTGCRVGALQREPGCRAGDLRKVSEKGRRTVSIDRFPKINDSVIPDSMPFHKKYVAHPQKVFGSSPFSKGGAGLQGGSPTKSIRTGVRWGVPKRISWAM